MTYETIAEIGQGSFGIVYKLKDKHERYYAKKVLNESAFAESDRLMLRRRFEREVRYQQMVAHPNVVSVIEADLKSNPPWFLMPLADCSLKDELSADRSLGGNPKQALFDILAGLEALHSQGLRHRDLKPANVLKFIDVNGASTYAISDFGLTTPGVGYTSTLTESNMGGGTPMYRPPECAVNFRRATEQADIYSFGAILHDVFGGGVSRIPHTELTVAGPLKDIVEKCTKSNPRRRYNSIASLRAELFNVLDKTDIVFSSLEEHEIIDILNSKNELEDHEWDRVFNFIDDNADKGASNQNIMRALTREHIRSINKSSSDMFQGLGEIYAKFASDGVFIFEYCDVIADKAQVFFALGDVSLKAKIALAMLELGTSHNRWLVEWIFMKMAGAECNASLAARIKMEIIAREYPFSARFGHIERSINVTKDRLHPILRELLPHEAAV